MSKTIEQKVAQAILQSDAASIEIGGKTYDIAPPSIATLILVSEIVSTLPPVEKAAAGDSAAIVASVLRSAKGFRALGDIAAVLILGAKRLLEPSSKPSALNIFRRKERAAIKRKERLARLILENVRPSVLWQVVVKRLNMQEVGDFFAITTSLSEANILKPTREVE